MDLFISPATLPRLESVHKHLLTEDAVTFVGELFTTFHWRIENLYRDRRIRAEDVRNGSWMRPSGDLLSQTSGNWKVSPVPPALQDRRLDLGDVSPANLNHLKAAFCANVQGIQVDFDDGHCPTWENTILGHYHVYQAVRNQLPDVPAIEKSPIIMFRPRAWNMTEHNFLVNGKPIPGPLFDFGLHMFHNGAKLHRIGRGPFFYLSKLEAAAEALLWDDIFIWSQNKLKIPIGSIKACVLIEDILAAFEMDAILFVLRRHSAGLNCGIWDYCASIISKFGTSPEFLLPDRNKYVNMEKPFLKKYLSLAVRVCRRRGTVATGGMAALMYNADSSSKVVAAKRKEIEAGVSGFMVYDIKLIPAIQKLWMTFGNQPVTLHDDSPIYSQELLEMPPGGVTLQGLKHNIRVTLLFIQNWLKGEGHFVLDGAVEDSATAEISRWQIIQWLSNKTVLEESGTPISSKLVLQEVAAALKRDCLSEKTVTIYLKLFTLREPPNFITTYLSDHELLSESQSRSTMSRL